MELSIVILAAGKGKRMGSTLAKVLHPIGGIPMLVHVVEMAQSLKPQQIIVVHGESAEPLKEALKNHEVVWAEQREQLGSGHAVACALDKIPSHHHVLTLLGDVPLILDETLSRFIQMVTSNAMGLLTAKVQDPTGLGRILRDDKGTILAIREERDASVSEKSIQEINTGIFLVPAAYLKKWLPNLDNKNAQAEYYLTDIIGFALDESISIVSDMAQHEEEVLGVNDKLQWASVERLYQVRLAKKLLSQGVMIADPHRFDMRGKTQFGNEVFVDVNVLFEGRNTVGKGVRIGANSILKNCTLADNVIIHPFSMIDGAQIGENTQIGPFARIRPHTVIDSDAKVGNFVELKNSVIGAQSKINHLSYIGDTHMGQRVNIGAGTITCNYDGANKHKTIIEDDVQVGSNSQLIAPVALRKGATLAAGSTLRKEAPAEKLTLTHRLEQRAYEWKKPVKIEKD